MRRRPFAFLCALGFGLVVLGCSDTAESTSPWVGKVAPAYALKPLEPGGDITANDFKGKVVLLDFWATWCGPCLQIMPQVADLAKKHREDLVVLGVSTETPTTIAKFKRDQFDPGYDLVFDPNGQTSMLYGVSSLPTTILIGRDGKIRHYEVGADADGGIRALEAAVDKALAEPK